MNLFENLQLMKEANNINTEKLYNDMIKVMEDIIEESLQDYRDGNWDKGDCKYYYNGEVLPDPAAYIIECFNNDDIDGDYVEEIVDRLIKKFNYNKSDLWDEEEDYCKEFMIELFKDLGKYFYDDLEPIPYDEYDDENEENEENEYKNINNDGVYVWDGRDSEIPEDVTIIEIKNGVTKIPDSFLRSWYKHVKTVIIPNSVTEIGSCAFDGCSNLTNITIPDSVTEIGAYAFRDCKKLKTINIPNHIKVIRTGTFNGAGLRLIKLPSQLISIEEHAFWYCKNLDIKDVPSNLKSIGMGAFSECYNLNNDFKNKIKMNPNIEIGFEAFGV